MVYFALIEIICTRRKLFLKSPFIITPLVDFSRGSFVSILITFSSQSIFSAAEMHPVFLLTIFLSLLFYNYRTSFPTDLVELLVYLSHVLQVLLQLLIHLFFLIHTQQRMSTTFQFLFELCSITKFLAINIKVDITSI